MNSKSSLPTIEIEETPKGSVKSYTWGFIFSIILTVIPFIIVINEHLTGWELTYTLLVFATIQLFVQLVLFLHLGHESKPRWNTISTLFAVLVVLIIVIGSLWIMANLDYHDMPASDIDKSIIEDELIKE